MFAYIRSWFTYRFADVVNVATAQDKDFVIKNFKICENKIKVRPNWIDCKKFTPLIMKNNSLLAVGRLSDQKNLPLCLNLRLILNKITLVGHGELKERLQREAMN